MTAAEKLKSKSNKEGNKDTLKAKRKGIRRKNKLSPFNIVTQVNDSPGLKMKMIDSIRNGVTKSEWKQLLESIESTEKEFQNILPVSISSMQKKEVYGVEASERIYEIARLFGQGYEVFDSKEDFNTWLKTPSKAIGNRIPFDLLDSSFGFELVENEIARIKYNVYS